MAGQDGSMDLGQQDANDEINVVDYVKILYKRRVAALTVFVVAVLSAVVYAFTMPPVYEARTRLLIESADPNVITFAQVVDEGTPGADYYQTQYGILQSRELARRTIEALALWQAPAFVGSGDQAVAGWTSAVSDTLRQLSGALGGGAATSEPELTETAAAGKPAEPELTDAQSRVIDAFLATVSVEPVKNSRLVDVTVRSGDPGVATRIANGLARNYIEQSLEYRFNASQEATNWLAERLAEQRRQVETAELALQKYREENNAVWIEDQDSIVVRNLTDLNSAVTRARTERLQKEVLERQLRAAERDPALLETYPAILANAVIQRQKADLADLQRQQAELSERLGERHPEMVKVETAIQSSRARLRAEVARVVQAAHTEYEAAVAQEQSLVSALDRQKTEALALNRNAIMHSVLTRELESAKQIYESLLKRAQETGVVGELKSSNIRILDRAERPRSHVSPNRRMNVLVGLLVGLLLAVSTVFALEYLDSTLKSPEEVRATLGLSTLGMVPALADRWTATAPLLHNGVAPAFAELIRTIRTNILVSAPRTGTRTLAITSTAPNEGKTLVASNLAVAFALSAQRVLLIDCDMRRSRVHELFGQNRGPGLADVLVGSAKVSEAVRKTDVAELWVLPAGETPPNPAELLSSTRFVELLRSLGGHFDTIILDTPPAAVVSDAVTIAMHVSDMIFVVGAEMTSRDAARAAVDQLRRAHAPIIGAVLNRVHLERDWYYYSRYYRPEYGAYTALARA